SAEPIEDKIQHELPRPARISFSKPRIHFSRENSLRIFCGRQDQSQFFDSTLHFLLDMGLRTNCRYQVLRHKGAAGRRSGDFTKKPQSHSVFVQAAKASEI